MNEKQLRRTAATWWNVGVRAMERIEPKRKFGRFSKMSPLIQEGWLAVVRHVVKKFGRV